MPMPALASSRRLALPLALLAGAAVVAPASAAVKAGRTLEAWPGIEMGIVDGYPGDVRVEIVRGTTRVGFKDLAGGGGEISHVGGADCWDGVPAGRSADIKPGDKLVATVLDGAGHPTSDVDSFFVRGIAFDETGPNVISGTAFGVQNGAGFDAGAPMAGETITVERRADAGRFAGSGTVAADGSFTVSLDGPPNEGAVAADFIGADGGNTVTEAGITNGGSVCGDRVTTATTSASHAVINAANVGSALVVGGPRSAPANVTQVTFGGKAYPATNDAATWSATIPAADLAALADNADHTLVTSFDDGSPDESRVIRKDVTAPAVASSVASGSYSAAQSVALSTDTGEQVRYTLDGSEPAAAGKAYEGIPIGLGNGAHTLRAEAVDAAGNRGVATFTYTIAPAATAPAAIVAPVKVAAPAQAGRALTVRALRIASRMSARAARRNGLRLTMSLARGTRVLQVSVFRKVGARRKLVTRVTRLPGRAGAYTVVLRSAKLRKALTAGLYTVVATPGGGDGALEPARQATRSFRITR